LWQTQQEEQAAEVEREVEEKLSVERAAAEKESEPSGRGAAVGMCLWCVVSIFGG